MKLWFSIRSCSFSLYEQENGAQPIYIELVELNPWATAIPNSINVVSRASWYMECLYSVIDSPVEVTLGIALMLTNPWP